jgi:NTP pyrophosphatase (non-canonical NTP hydrolase)
MSKILDQYSTFVDGVTSDASKDTEQFIIALSQLKIAQGCDVARLMTAFIGLAAEGGEGLDVVKKLAFHGKQYTPEVREHLIKELGDVAWYWMYACIALDIDPEEVLVRNIEKLESRYPGGKFSIERSENRAEGDI